MNWRKSTRSTNTDNCVEIAGDLAAVRDSKNPAGEHLRFARNAAVPALVAAIRAGRLDR